jgi:hypothetical protein
MRFVTIGHDLAIKLLKMQQLDDEDDELAYRYHKKHPIERLDQGHPYPNLEVPGLTCPGRGSNPGLPRGKRAL